ncbi:MULTISPECIES: CDP-glycerol glycerophosphotransferase family protein [Heyndrickxia]|uniref:CDP-glycerol glycerophosphotransferase family protein n=1 Tax=Heyndrickxia TaxID=2837504 RepID=UPI000CE2B2E0|nr:CDP-glycerol glycerophosphotransferase family protein [Heyndrickxia coagulans]AVD55066.1 CDP-glycerol--glycerophosphate glycerophosphotransferase [Heyndrickxia coagulans]
MKKIRKYGFFYIIISLIKISIAYIIYLIDPKKPKKQIILLGEHLGRKYEDNAAVFHKYLVDKAYNKYDAYWIYDAEVVDPFLNEIKNAVELGSIFNYYLFFKSNYVIYTHSLSLDIAPLINKLLFLNPKTKIIYVSHGIEGFKKVINNKNTKNLLKECHYINCLSRYEYQIKHNEWGIPNSRLIITGMPRLDNLINKANYKKKKSILFFPTWREWLITNNTNDLLQSNYYNNIVNLAENQHIKKVLAKKNVELKIVLHPFMKAFINTKKTNWSNNIHLFNSSDFTDGSIQKELINADILITDYSSVAWDFYYMNKPIIFFHFDQIEYEQRRGSYLNLDTNLFGYKAKNVQEILDTLNYILSNNIIKNIFYPEIHNYFDFVDDKNCYRLYKTLENLNN